MDKQSIREEIWDSLDQSGIARFPYPPHGRIPNFAGAKDAADRLQEITKWDTATVIKSNPDAPQLPVRRAALAAGKVVYMAVPRLRDERCFIRLDPRDIADTDYAATIGGSADIGVQVKPEEMESIDLVVAGSVAVDTDGSRIGKGEGYSDLEWAILREFSLVSDETVTVTTVHDTQIIDEEIPTTPLDVPMDWIITPSKAIEIPDVDQKPDGIVWEKLQSKQFSEIPILEQIK